MKQYHLLLLPIFAFTTTNLFSMQREEANYYIKAPSDMSKEDAFVALYKGAKKLGTGWNAFGCDQPFLNRIDATQAITSKKEVVRGRSMRVTFDEFPFIAIAAYEKVHGTGKAKKALDKHWKRFRKKRTKSLS